MSPCPTANGPVNMADAQSPRLNQRRNAMANVMDGMTNEDMDLIRAQHGVSTAQPTCMSATASSMSTTRQRSTSSTSTSSSGEMEKMNGSGLAALSLPDSSSPHQSPSLRRRRNGVPDIFADVDTATLSRLRRASRDQSTSQHEMVDDTMFAF